MNDEVSRPLKSAQSRLKTLLTNPDPSSPPLPPYLSSELQQILEDLRAAQQQSAKKRASQKSAFPSDHDKQYFQILDNLPDGYIITDTEGIIVQVNHAAAHLFNQSAAALQGKSITAFIVEKEKSILAALPKSGGAISGQAYELTARRTGKASFPALVHVSSTRDSPDRLHWLVRDLTVIKEAEKAKERFEFLSYASQLLSAVPDLATRIERVTRLAVPAFADLCVLHVRDGQGALLKVHVAHADPAKEKELAEIESQYLTQVPPMPAVSEGIAADKRKFATRVTSELLNDIAHADEHLRVLRQLGLKSYISVPLKTHGRSYGAVAFATAESGRVYSQDDLTLAEAFARRAALAIENALRYEEAQAALVERDRALNLALQEIKIPLNVISNLTQIVKTQLQFAPMTPDIQPGGVAQSETRELLREHLENISRAGERLQGMIGNLAELSRIQNQTLKLLPNWFNLSELVYSVVGNIRMQQEDGRYPRDVKIRVHMPPAVQISLHADEERIAQALTILLDNALKYSPRGGTVDVRLELRESDDSPPSPQAHLIVCDEGIGVPPEEHTRIFQPFVRATNTQGRNISGIGVGLAICYEIIARHEGRIWVESEGINRGSEFHILLPKVEVEGD